jgi:B-cell receptor-associated protein 31
MQQLLFAVIFWEMALILVLLFKTPLRKLVILGLDRVKRGHGPIMVKTVAGTVVIVLISSVYSMTKIQKRWIDEGALNPTDQVLMAKHLLEATLMGNLNVFFFLVLFGLHSITIEVEIIGFFLWILICLNELNFSK